MLKRVNSLEELRTKAKKLNLTIELKQKNVMYTLEEDGQMITLSHKKVSDKGIRVIQILENLQEDYQTFLSRW